MRREGCQGLVIYLLLTSYLPFQALLTHLPSSSLGQNDIVVSLSSHPVSIFQFISLFSVLGSQRQVIWGGIICAPHWCQLLQPSVDRWLEQLTSQVIASVSFCFQNRDQFPTKQRSILTKAFVKKYKKFTLQRVRDHFSNSGLNCFSFILLVHILTYTQTYKF